MTSYSDAGVNISAGDQASRTAYEYAKKTFSARENLIGTPLIMDGGFAGAIDMGEYLLINCCDGVGTKIDIALETGIIEGLGYDLLAMTADDAICTGAEIISITNTIDTASIQPQEIECMMKSLSNACIQERVIIPGGEIAELGNTLSKTIWNSSAVGIVEKEKFITGNDVQPGDHIITLKEKGFRSNGFSLVRYILEKQGISFQDEYSSGKTWADILLTPSQIYHSALLNILGRYGQDRVVNIHGIVHITGGGIPGNLNRILKQKKLGARLDNLFPPCKAMHTLQEIGGVEDRELYTTWNAGNGMMILCDPACSEVILSTLEKLDLEAQKAGEVNTSGEITIQNKGFYQVESMLAFQ